MLAIKTGEFSIGKLMVKNCMDAIFNQPPLQHLPRFNRKSIPFGKSYSFASK